MTEGLEPTPCNGSYAGRPAPGHHTRRTARAPRAPSPQPNDAAHPEGAALLCARRRGVEDCVDCPDFPCRRVGHLMEGRQGMLMWLVLCYGGGAPSTHKGV